MQVRRIRRHRRQAGFEWQRWETHLDTCIRRPVLLSSLDLDSVGADAVKHALVIEDNHLIAMMIEEELVDHGYGLIEVATSQHQAIGMAAARCPDLITVDDKLDSGTGVETIRVICRNQAIPVVFITAEPDSVRMAMADAIIVLKPFSKSQLTAAIGAAIDAPMTS